MNNKAGIVLFASLLPGVSFAQSSLTTEQRLALLEQRLLAAETRADKAEAEIKKLTAPAAVAMKNSVGPAVSRPAPAEPVVSTADHAEPVTAQTAVAASAPALSFSRLADLKFYGDVEFNVDGASRSGSLGAIKSSTGSHERWDVNGRVLLGVDGYRKSSNDRFSGFSVQPLAKVSGGMGLDDAVFFFGQEKNWQAKVGRFEAYDMFPLNQDTFVEYSGNTANDLYDDGYGYIYMMKEGRGRSSSGGAVQLNKTSGPLYVELNAMAKDGTTLFQDSQYHGRTLENKKNVITLRPVAALTVDQFTAALAMESNVIRNAYGYYDEEGRFYDQSKRTGYGATFSWNGQRQDPDNGLLVSLSTAYLDAEQEQDFSAGLNTLWRDLEVGYIYARNNIQQFDYSNAALVSTDDAMPGKYNLHTVHTSYRFRNVMDMENFNVYLGAYWSRMNVADRADDLQDKNRYGMRVRFKYLF